MNRKESYNGHDIVEIKSIKLDIGEAEQYLSIINIKYLSLVLLVPGVISEKQDEMVGLGHSRNGAFEKAVYKCKKLIDNR